MTEFSFLTELYLFDCFCQKNCINFLLFRCKSGIAIQGSSTSDVVCKNASEEVIEPPKAHTTPFQTTTISSTSTSRTTVSSSNNTDNFNSLCNLPFIASRFSNQLQFVSLLLRFNSYFILGLVMVFAGILPLAGLLYHKCKITHCIHNHKKVDFRKGRVPLVYHTTTCVCVSVWLLSIHPPYLFSLESVCSKPVEESGEKCLSLLV